MQFFTQIIALALAAAVVASPAPKISQQEIDKVRALWGNVSAVWNHEG